MKAEYIDHMGDDLRVVNAARVSFDNESDYAQMCPCGTLEGEGCGGERPYCSFQWDTQILSKRDEKLIGYLARNGHWTPFSHPQVTMRETVPIFVARQRFKHMVGFTYNEVSRRYVDSEPEFYSPEVWRGRAPNAKQGSSEETVEHLRTIETATEYNGVVRLGGEWDPVREFNHIALEVYQGLLAQGICPEQARMVLPQSILTSYYVTGSLAAWARAYKLRIDPHAQAEIRELAQQWDTIIRPLFPVSWAALTGDNT